MSRAGGVRRALGRLPRETARAVRDAHRAWAPWAWMFPTSFAVAAAAPAVFGSARLAAFAAGLLVALAAVGLNFAVGLAGMPSLAQGAFAGLGAFGSALLQAKLGWDPVSAWAGGVTIALASGLVVGAGAVRLRGAVVAVATWAVTWLVGFALVAFPGLTGGSRGLVVPETAFRVPGAGTFLRFTSGVQYELALALLAAALAAYWALDRGAIGLALGLVRRGPDHAASIGIRAGRLQLGAFAASAATGGAAGALAVQIAGVADPSAYGPLFSVELFVAVLLGGEGTALGPVVGAGALAAIGPAADAIGSVAGVAAERFEPVIASALLVVALLLGRGGLVKRFEAAIARLGPPGRPPAPAWRAQPTSRDRTGGAGPDLLEAEGVSKRYGGVVALDGVSIDLSAGEIHMVIGPNGSGKTTLLRTLSGVIRPDGGAIRIRGEAFSALSSRARAEAGLVRTPPRTVVARGLTAIEHVAAGTIVRRRHGGAIRTLLATPLARTEAAEMRGRAEALLGLFGLADLAEFPVERLPGTEQRLVMIATACAAGPDVLMLDEPSAGMSAVEARHLAAVLLDLRSTGLALLVVEHNMRIVRLVADRVTVLDAGRVIAHGSPDQVGADPAVVEAYLGPRGL